MTPDSLRQRGFVRLWWAVIVLALGVVVMSWQAYEGHQARLARRAAAVPVAQNAPLAGAVDVDDQALALSTPMPADDSPRQPGPLPARRSPGQEAGDPVPISPRGEPGAGTFRCDGRQHCSQMRSCEEATFFLRHCPNTKMDGDRDGVPCESQWCAGQGR